MLNEINSRVRKYLDHLFEVPVTVKFRNEDMKIETDVTYDGVSRGLGLLSGGQFRRVSLAVDLALSDVITARKGSRIGITIWDEYMKDLSESSMEKVLELFTARNQPTILIEHNSLFKQIVSTTIFVKLENGTSHVQI
jgi:DNA repair exonuclease SbcCD ATPase subunit